MEQNTSTSVIDEIDPVSFLGIPHEVRLHLLEHVPPKERRVLRQTCGRLYDDIDEYLGPLSCLNLSDKKSQQILDFYARTFFRQIEVSKSCLFDGFKNILYKPHMIESIAVNHPAGIVDSKFLIEFLQKSKRLTSLKLKGIIKGLIPREEGVICLPGLKHLQIQISDEVCVTWKDLVVTEEGGLYISNSVNPNRIEIALDIWWENQLALLSRLIVPKCEEISLGLRFRKNILMENFDELELAQATFNFIARHRNCRSWNIFVRTSQLFGSSGPSQPFHLTPLSQHSFYHRKIRKSSPNDLVPGPDPIQLPTGYIGMKKLGYFSELADPSTLEEHFSEFMRSLTGLDRLIMWRRPLQWGLLMEIIWNNRETLKVLVIHGYSLTMANRLDIFSCCTTLKAVWFDVGLWNESESGYLWSPISLIPSANIIANLSFLVIHRPLKIAPEELITLPQLVNLQYLSLHGINSHAVFPLEALFGILGMRSLKGLFLPFHPLFLRPLITETGQWMPIGPEGVPRARLIYHALFPWMTADGISLLLSDPVDPNWWKPESKVLADWS